MASYPAVDISRVTLSINTGAVHDVAPSGQIFGHRHWGQVNYDLTVMHDYLSEVDKATIESFVNANRNADDIEIEYDGDTYTCVFSAAEEIRPMIADRWYAAIYLRGTKS